MPSQGSMNGSSSTRTTIPRSTASPTLVSASSLTRGTLLCTWAKFKNSRAVDSIATGGGAWPLAAAAGA